jgi:hypothetical protein
MILFETVGHDACASHVMEIAVRQAEDGDDLEWQPVQCITGPEWPCFYQGILPIHPRLLGHGHRLHLLFRLRECEQEVHRVFLLVRYARDQRDDMHNEPRQGLAGASLH